jgi:oligopeptidase A
MLLHFQNKDVLPISWLEQSVNDDVAAPHYETILHALEMGFVETDVRDTIKDLDADLEKLLDHVGDTPTWENFMIPFEEWNAYLSRVMTPLFHLMSVHETADRFEEIYRNLSDDLSEHSFKLLSNERLYRTFGNLIDSGELSPERLEIVEDWKDSFDRGGFNLSDEDKDKLRDVSQKLSILTSTFSQNVVNGTRALNIVIEDVNELKGCTKDDLAMFEAASGEKGKYTITMQVPHVSAVMRRCLNREMRKRVFEMSTSIATAAQEDFDNTSLIEQIRTLREQKAAILGHENHASRILVERMAGEVDTVIEFLDSFKCLKDRAYEEYLECERYAKEKLGYDEYEDWDGSFVYEQIVLEKFNFTSKQVANYFPTLPTIEKVLDMLNRIWGIAMTEVKIDSGFYWNEDVVAYDVHRNGDYLGMLFMDLHSHEFKRPGAWMSDACNRYMTGVGLEHTPVSYVVCNFTPLRHDGSDILTHDHLTTLLHELGHAIHSLVTTVNIPSVTGINGVPWDAVELPSQMMENWAWDKESLRSLSSEHQGHVMPNELIDQLIASRQYAASAMLVRQVKMSKVDMLLHTLPATMDPY